MSNTITVQECVEACALRSLRSERAVFISYSRTEVGTLVEVTLNPAVYSPFGFGKSTPWRFGGGVFGERLLPFANYL